MSHDIEEVSGHSAPLLRVGALAKRAGKTPRALRFYEEMGLLNPVQRTQGGFRLYHPDALIRIHWIDRLQDLGFSLPETRDFLDQFRNKPTGVSAMDQLRIFYQKKLEETQGAMKRLQTLEAELQDSLLYLEGCQTCEAHGSLEACRGCDQPHAQSEMPLLVAAVSSSH